MSDQIVWRRGFRVIDGKTVEVEEAVVQREITRSCPCLHTTPCDPQCTCVAPHMSTGCDRCCTYGSPEQQRAAAERIAACIARG